MIITCKCLNVSLQLGNKKAQAVNLPDLELSNDEKSHSFFSSAVAEVRDVSVAKQIEALIISQTVGTWTIETCINCSLSYLASKSICTDPKPMSLISANLIADPNTVAQLKNHAHFSTVFRILVKPQSPTETPIPDLNVQIAQTSLSSLQKNFAEAVQKEALKTEEAIRAFTEQQYEQLERFRDRANRDHRALVRIISEQLPKNNPESLIENMSLMNITTPPATPTVIAAQTDFPTSNIVTNIQKKKEYTPPPAFHVTHMSVNRSISLPTNKSDRGRSNSLDAEGVFDLEENMDETLVMDTTPPIGNSQSDPESDTDPDDSGSHDEGIEMGLRRSQSLSMAKSLPVNMLRVTTTNLEALSNTGDLQQIENDDDDFTELRQSQIADGNDIAESIKAIARSLHGSAVFGDLPRPRFSTNI